MIYWQKAKIRRRYILELTIHKVKKSKQYPDGIKYGLICLDIKTDRQILMDNHHPKGPHIHFNDKEIPYEFSNDDKLIEDFKKLVLEHMGVKL
ncbi:hypothetical protein ACFLRA_00810 [Bdellovibrionota bacterium]